MPQALVKHSEKNVFKLGLLAGQSPGPLASGMTCTGDRATGCNTVYVSPCPPYPKMVSACFNIKQDSNSADITLEVIANVSCEHPRYEYQCQRYQSLPGI